MPLAPVMLERSTILRHARPAECGSPRTSTSKDHIDQWWETQTPPPLSCRECGHTRPIPLVPHALYIRAERIELLNEVRVATVNVGYIVNHGLPLGHQAG